HAWPVGWRAAVFVSRGAVRRNAPPRGAAIAALWSLGRGELGGPVVLDAGNQFGGQRHVVQLLGLGLAVVECPLEERLRVGGALRIGRIPVQQDEVGRGDRPRIGTRGVGDHQVEVLGAGPDRKSTRLNSSHVKISYAVFCLKKNNTQHNK